ncbi:hypothetical protein TH19_14745 [Thalassospira profundimaris]|uniref:Uncharacterized protein n=2 Tax=Thalassospira profundimaris TaxID=502049 RepID=A0A367W3I5_9PROT|nr:hypothetical protein TH19_14745 [Thalassospira profundimaris]
MVKNNKAFRLTILTVSILMSTNLWGTPFIGESHAATMAMAATAATEKSCEESGFSAFMKKLGLQGNRVSKSDLPPPLSIMLSKENVAHKEKLEESEVYKQARTDFEYHMLLAAVSFGDRDYALSLYYMGKLRAETDDLPANYYFYYAFMTYRLSMFEDYDHNRDQLVAVAKQYADTYLALAGDCADFAEDALKISAGKVL